MLLCLNEYNIASSQRIVDVCKVWWADCGGRQSSEEAASGSWKTLCTWKTPINVWKWFCRCRVQRMLAIKAKEIKSVKPKRRLAKQSSYRAREVRRHLEKWSCIEKQRDCSSIFCPLGNKIYFQAKPFHCFSPPTWLPWKPSIGFARFFFFCGRYRDIRKIVGKKGRKSG